MEAYTSGLLVGRREGGRGKWRNRGEGGREKQMGGYIDGGGRSDGKSNEKREWQREGSVKQKRSNK